MRRRIELLLAQSGQSTRTTFPRSVVLCYHSVHPSNKIASVRPALFDQHLEWIKAECEIVPFASIHEATAAQVGDRPIVAFTFDDGYADNYTYAFPKLLKHGISATFFLTTGLLERDPMVTARFSRLWKVPAPEVEPLTWTQVAEMRGAGMAFGSHTWSHPSLLGIDQSTAVEEISSSKQVLEDHLQEPACLFAYPFGRPRRDFSTQTMNLLMRFQFTHAAAVQYRGVRAADNPLSIPRFAVTNDSLDVLRAKIYGNFDVFGVIDDRIPLWLSRLIRFPGLPVASSETAAIGS